MTRIGKLARRGDGRGFSLIELMVGIAISLVVTLVIFNVFTLSESRKRTSTSVNDVNQAGAYGMYVMDKAVRSAGSGLTAAWSDAYGCRLNVQFAGANLLPRATPFPAPFTAVSQTLSLVPVLIGQGQSDTGSDVLITMAGTSGFGEAPARMRPSDALFAASRTIQLRNTIGFRHGDLVLIGNPGTPCLVSQVQAPVPASTAPAVGIQGGTVQELPLGPAAGSYFTTAGANVSMAALVTGGAFVAPIGNVSPAVPGGPAQNPPLFRMYGVGANQILFSYDPLRVDALLAGVLNDQATPILEGVVAMRALYGVDTNDDGVFDAWQAPTGAWAAAAPGLLDNTDASRDNLRRIVSVRVGLVLRTSLIEKEVAAGVPVTPAVLPQQLFADLGGALALPVNVAAADRNFRYRIVETTIPLRNNLMPQR